MTRYPKLEAGRFYHVYNRGNNREPLFRTGRNYAFFLQRYAHHVDPVVETLAYCLLGNHFHLLVRVRTPDEVAARAAALDRALPSASRAFSNLFNSYAKAINRAYGRTGSLFEKRFSRLMVDNRRYGATLVRYIHHNPQHHGFAADFRTYPHSSYRALLADGPTRLGRARVLGWFGGRAGFVTAHERPVSAAALPDDLPEASEGPVKTGRAQKNPGFVTRTRRGEEVPGDRRAVEPISAFKLVTKP